MKLLTKTLMDRFQKVGDQGKERDPLVIAKFFNPAGAGTWYATDYNPEIQTFSGFVSIFGDHNDEWGDFSLEELENFRGSFGLGIERDLFFSEKRASELPQIKLYLEE